jgi:hypothetical protein
LINGKHGQATHSPEMGADIRPKIPQIPQNLSAQFVCPSRKVLNIIEKRLHQASVIRNGMYQINKYYAVGICAVEFNQGMIFILGNSTSTKTMTPKQK